MEIINDAMQSIALVNQEKMELVQEMEELSVKVQTYEQLHQNQDYEKSKFMEGASWIAQKIIKEANKQESRLTILLKEFESRI